MKIFTGLITETNSRKVAVIAETKEEANAILSDLYYNGDIDELNDDDYDGCGIQKLMMKLLIAQNLMTLRFMMKMEMNMKKTIFQKKISTLRRYSEL